MLKKCESVKCSPSPQGYMVELTTHQSSVGRVLRAGAALLREGNLSEEEEEEVREQMNLLNSRWEHLRVASMERQSRYCAKTLNYEMK